MRWDEVMEQAVVPSLEADASLVGLLGGSNRIWPAEESREIQFDSIEWLIVSDIELEVFNRLIVQFDIRANRTDEDPALKRAAEMERRVRRIMTRPMNGRLQGVWVNARVDDARTMPVPEPGLAHRQIDFVLEPLRERYTAANLL